MLALTETTYDCHCVRRQDLCGSEHSEVGNVGEHVDGGDERQGDVDGSGQVMSWILQLFCYKRHVVPAGVAEQTGVEGKGYVSRGGCRILQNNFKNQSDI